MSKLHELPFLYRLGKKYVLWVYRQYYSEYILLGEENLVANGESVIYASNHQNALMDSLGILSLPPFDLAKIYLSRADLFKLPPVIVKFIRFAKLIPAYRIRDGYENLGKNKASFDEADEVLLNKAALVIMPEGNQAEEKKVRPLVKGIFRIAFSAQEKMPTGKTVYIQPIGIDMGDLIKCGKHLIINIGKPIAVADYMEQYAENQSRAINSLRSKLKSNMDGLIQSLDTENYYEAFETAIDASAAAVLKKEQLRDDTINRFQTGQVTAAKLVELEKNDLSTMQQLDQLCKLYRKTLQQYKLRTSNLEQQLPVNKLRIDLLIILKQLLFAPGFLLNLLPVLGVRLTPRMLGIEYIGFYSSAYYGAGLIFYPLFYILQSLLIVLLTPLSGISFLILLIVHYYGGKYSFQLYKQIKALKASKRLLKLNTEHPSELAYLRELKSQITDIVLALPRKKA